jgi:predicted metalloprotease
MGGGLGLPRGRVSRRAGIGGGFGAILIVLLALLFGVDPGVLLQGGMPSQPGVVVPQSAPVARTAEENRLAEFVSVVLADTEDTWGALFDEMGGTYQQPTLVLFTGRVQSACGFAGAAMGPFYCPADQQVYIDLGFYQELDRKLGAPGDFAQAYVLAHEVGHHVQTLLGITQQVDQMRRQVSRTDGNQLSVLTELQADCFAGVWAYHANARGLLEPGDAQEAIQAAGAVGDDTLQRRSQGMVVPDSFTHGSSEQRIDWFVRGFETGDPGACNTFEQAGR